MLRCGRLRHLRHLRRPGALVLLLSAHVSATVAAWPVGVEQQQFSGKMAGNTANFPQCDLKLLGLRHGVTVQQRMHRCIRGQERKPVQNLEAAEHDITALAGSLQAQGRLVDQLHGQSRFGPHGRLPRPTAQQVPGAQAEVFRDQQPQAHRRVTDLVGESLSNAALDAERIAVDVPNRLARDPGHDLFGHHARTALVEFFFEARIR